VVIHENFFGVVNRRRGSRVRLIRTRKATAVPPQLAAVAVLLGPEAPSRGHNSTSRRPFQRAPRATVPPSTRGRQTKGRRFLCAEGVQGGFKLLSVSGVLSSDVRGTGGASGTCAISRKFLVVLS